MSKPVNDNQTRFWITILLVITAGTTVFLISPVSAEKPVVSLVAYGSGSYFLGEEVVFSGVNTVSDSTYLYMTGPNLPDGGVKLSSPSQKAVSGDAGSFTVVTTKPDKTWEYSWYTSGLRLDAGTYTIYAVSQPKAKDQLAEASYGTTGIIVKKPFLEAEISPSSVLKGQSFSITGYAEGIPSAVQLWIIGGNYVYTATTPVNSDASYSFLAVADVSGKLPKGPNYLIVQHPMQDNQFDIGINGDFVRSLKLNNGTNVFRVTGPGNLQGSDAAEAFVAVFSDPMANTDTYTIVPFQVMDAESLSAVPVSGASAGSGVTISVDGDKSYYLGEKVVFRGKNTGSDSTYLFLTGPNLAATGVKLTSPDKAVASGNPDSFTLVKTKPDKTWEYTYYTANLPFYAGTYSVYAVSQPKAKDQLGQDAANVGIIIKKPFITAGISSPDVVKGQPFTVTGTAEGIPPEIQIWIIGDDYISATKTPVNSENALFTFTADAAMSGKLIAGQNYLVVQHPMADNQFDFVVSGDYVCNLKQNNGTNVFKLTGPGSLRGSDAAYALIAAISDQEVYDRTYTSDMYTLVPFQVTDAGSSASEAPAATTDPVQQSTRPDILHLAMAGAIVMVVGIVIWKRH